MKCGANSGEAAFTGGERMVPVSRRSATGPGRQLRQASSPRRTTVTFQPQLRRSEPHRRTELKCEANSGEAAFTGEEQTAPEFAGGARRNWGLSSGQASAPRRTAVTFSRNFDEANLIGGRR